MSDELDDNAETTAGLLEVVRRLVSTYKHLQMDTPKDQAILDKATDLAERALDTLAARLADSRPVVSEAAITDEAVEAAADAMAQFCPSNDRQGVRCVTCMQQARAALTAALPHMGDARGEAFTALADSWEKEMPQFPLADGTFAGTPFWVVELRATIADPSYPFHRLSPTGDDTP